MKITPALNQLTRRPGPAAYKTIAVVSGLTVVVWMLFSSFDIRDINGWLPYHVPISIFLSLVLLILALRSWIKILLGREPPSRVVEEGSQRRPEP